MQEYNPSVTYISDRNPEYLKNEKSSLDGSVYSSFVSIINSLKETTMGETKMEASVRLFLGLSLDEDVDSFIRKRYKNYYNTAKEDVTQNKLDGLEENKLQEHLKIINIVYSRFANEGMAYYKRKTKGKFKSKIAIINDRLPDGRYIMDGDPYDRLALCKKLIPDGWKIVEDDKIPVMQPIEEIEQDKIIDNNMIIDFEE